MKVVFTGGHHNSALVIAKQMKERQIKIVWIGHRYSILGDKQVSAEYNEVTKQGIPFYNLTAGKLQIKYKFFQYLFRIPVGFVQGLYLLLKIKPDLIFSWGGYLALPIAWCGWLLRVPVITHEQTLTGGLANRLIAPVSKKIFTSFPLDYYRYPKSKMIYTGLPVRNEIFSGDRRLFKNLKKTIYITGGKQGSHIINEIIFSKIKDLVKRYNIIHQCGTNTVYRDYEKARTIKGNLAFANDSYLIKDYLSAVETGTAYQNSDLVISRAGAHTVYELLALEKPAILIPIPWSNMDEQNINAQFYFKSGLGEILLQKDLTVDNLVGLVNKMMKNLSKYKLKKQSAVPLDGQERIIREINQLLPQTA